MSAWATSGGGSGCGGAGSCLASQWDCCCCCSCCSRPPRRCRCCCSLPSTSVLASLMSRWESSRQARPCCREKKSQNRVVSFFVSGKFFLKQNYPPRLSRPRSYPTGNNFPNCRRRGIKHLQPPAQAATNFFFIDRPYPTLLRSTKISPSTTTPSKKKCVLRTRRSIIEAASLLHPPPW